VAKLIPRDIAKEHWAGYSVALQGQTIVVGALWAADSGGRAGAAYVYQRDGTEWHERAKLRPAQGELEDHFGYRVAIDGNTIAVGAVQHRVAPGRPRSGCVFVYRDISPAGDWSQFDAVKVCAGDAAGGDWFGCDVALQDDLLVVGARYHDSRKIDSGSAYIFRREGPDWIEEVRLTPENVLPNGQFGAAVAIDGDRIVVGAEYDPIPNVNCGTAYLFQQRDGQWEQISRLVSDDCDVDDRFGADVALDGDTALIGAECDDENGKDAGAAYVFDLRRILTEGDGAPESPETQ
jgi:hypothetical protein